MSKWARFQQRNLISISLDLSVLRILCTVTLWYACLKAIFIKMMVYEESSHGKLPPIQEPCVSGFDFDKNNE